MSKKIMNVDVDLVVADSLPVWLQWFKKNSRDNIDFDFSWHDGPYHLSKTMKKHMDIDPEEFWRTPDLYDYVDPMTGSEEVLRDLSEEYDIRFITHSIYEHKQSKNLFLERHFPFNDGVYHVEAEEKWEFDADVWVEDRVDTIETLVQTQPDCHVFHMVNDLNKNYQVFGATRVFNWRQISARLGVN